MARHVEALRVERRQPDGGRRADQPVGEFTNLVRRPAVRRLRRHRDEFVEDWQRTLVLKLDRRRARRALRDEIAHARAALAGAVQVEEERHRALGAGRYEHKRGEGVWVLDLAERSAEAHRGRREEEEMKQRARAHARRAIDRGEQR